MHGSKATPWSGRAGKRCGPRRCRHDGGQNLAAIAEAARPVIIAGPQMSTMNGRALLARLEAATGAPAVIMESPRGIADATLGAFPDAHQARRPDRAARQGARLHHQVGDRPSVRSRRADHCHRSGRRDGRARQKGNRRAAADRLRRRHRPAPARRCSRARQRFAARSDWHRKRARRSTTGRRNGAASSRRPRAGCIRRKCSGRCVPLSSATPTRC